MMRALRDRVAVLAGAAALAGLVATPLVAAEIGVFQGDPLDQATGRPYVLLPGVPLVYPGPDGVYGTADDVVDTGVTGDVDLVARTQGAVASGVIPPPASSVATAPLVVAGGEHGYTGTRLPFQVIVSDGATPPAAGSALAAPELDAHGALVIAYPDLDDDGVIGPTGAPGAAVEVQRQETLQTAGRRPAIFLGGVAADSLGVSLGAPASAGGLGLVVAAIGTTGATPGLYFDGPWIATALPYMLPLDPSTYFNSDGEPSADGVVEIELTREELLLPAPSDPILGAAYALPLDGSNVTVDLARAVSGPVAGAVFARPVDAETFVADFARRLVPVVDGQGVRRLVESIDTLAMANDGPGGTQSLLVFPADLLGNSTDPAQGGTTLVIEAGPNLRIVAPDGDGDPQRETLPFTSAAYATITIDDAGSAGGAGEDRVVAELDGVPVASVKVTLSSGAPLPTVTPAATSTAGASATPTPVATSTPSPSAGDWLTARVQMARAKKAAHDRVTLAATFAGDAQAIDPATQTVELTLRNAGGTVYARTIDPGTLVANRSRTVFGFRDAQVALRVARSRRASAKHAIHIVASRLDLAAVDVTAANVTVTLRIGDATYEGTLVCRVAKNRRSARCLK